MKNIIFCLLLSFATTAFADPRLDLLAGHEWKGDCNKVVNEGGKEIKGQPYLRLQSAYSAKGKTFFWWVKSFKDQKCTKIHESRKSTFECTFLPQDEFAECKQISADVSSDEKIWKAEKLVDHAGYPINFSTQVKVEKLAENKVKLHMPGESEENPPEVLTK